MRRYLAAILAGAALLSGCGMPLRPRDVSDLQPVETMGFDADGENVILSVSDAGEDTVRLSARGVSLPEAEARLQTLADREELFYAHTRFVLAGEALAAEGLDGVLDHFRRNPQTRLTIPLLVVRSGTARELICPQGEDSAEITGLLRSLSEGTARAGTPECVSMLSLTRQLNRSGAALCASVRFARAGESDPDRPEARLALPDGYAVIKNGALAGFLDREEALGADLLRGRAGPAELSLPGGASVKLRGGRTSLRWEDGVLRGEIDLRAGITALNNAGPLTEEALSALEQAAAERLANACFRALTALRDMGADVLELGLRFAPEADREALLRQLGWEIRLRVTLARSYDADGGVDLRGGGQ